MNSYLSLYLYKYDVNFNTFFNFVIMLTKYQQLKQARATGIFVYWPMHLYNKL